MATLLPSKRQEKNLRRIRRILDGVYEHDDELKIMTQLISGCKSNYSLHHLKNDLHQCLLRYAKKYKPDQGPLDLDHESQILIYHWFNGKNDLSKQHEREKLLNFFSRAFPVSMLECGKSGFYPNDGPYMLELCGNILSCTAEFLVRHKKEGSDFLSDRAVRYYIQFLRDKLEFPHSTVDQKYYQNMISMFQRYHKDYYKGYNLSQLFQQKKCGIIVMTKIIQFLYYD